MSEEYIKQKLENYVSESFMKCLGEHGGWIAGGAITSIATNREINDVDTYFANKDSLVNCIRFMQEEGAWCNFVSDKSITYCYDGLTYQFIYYGFYESTEDIWKDFDFDMVMGAYNASTKEIALHDNFLLHNAQRHLNFNSGTKFPILSMLRLNGKLRDWGYKAPRSEVVKVALAISALNIQTWEELKNQCGALYGMNYLQDTDFEGKEFSIEEAVNIVGKKMSTDAEPLVEYKIDPRVVDVVISEQPVKYVKMKDNKIKVVYPDHEYDNMLEDLILNGNIKAEEVSIIEHLGEFIYKWVKREEDGTYCSHYNTSFKYNIGEEVVAKGLSWGGSPALWFRTYDGLRTATYSKQGVVLKCKYDPKDIIQIENNGDILVSKVVPVEEVEYTEKENRL